MKIEKIKKSSRAAYITTNILKVMLIVCAILAWLGGITVMGLGGIINQSFDKALKGGQMKERDIAALKELTERELGRRLMEGENYAMTIGVYMMVFGIAIALLALVLHFVSRVFKEFMESYSPFQPGILKNLKIALVLIVVYTAQSSLGIALVIAMASWCIMNIFEYGCELQKQSDETL